ncbi:hypothetical protein CRG98_014167 [Punica granatum]|uniref:Uncharacterized protein n=1 Tax=Punica granatum TaxID=22663 RepID=A0A2I0KA50_PUNGR|nr:hypothetical protein CRG98_014167 [Punica granatum]
MALRTFDITVFLCYGYRVTSSFLSHSSAPSRPCCPNKSFHFDLPSPKSFDLSNFSTSNFAPNIFTHSETFALIPVCCFTLKMGGGVTACFAAVLLLLSATSSCLASAAFKDGRHPYL